MSLMLINNVILLLNQDIIFTSFILKKFCQTQISINISNKTDKCKKNLTTKTAKECARMKVVSQIF